MRVAIAQDPGLQAGNYLFSAPSWPSWWVGPAGLKRDEPVVLAFRRRFTVAAPATVRIHVTADQRYDLYLDGSRIGWGSERGDPDNWFYESHDLALARGPHVIVARVWWAGLGELAPCGHASAQPGFLLHAEGEWTQVLSTGCAAWQCKRLGGYRFAQPRIEGFYAVGSRTHIVGGAYDWGFEQGTGRGWKAAERILPAVLRAQGQEARRQWLLRPAVLPPMFEQTVRVGGVWHAQTVTDADVAGVPVEAAANEPALQVAWQRLLATGAAVTVPARTAQRIVIDLGNYYCAFPELTCSGGAGARVRLTWAESLFMRPQGFEKGNRDAWDGKFLRGLTETFEPDGGAGRRFETLWWGAGRYVEIVAATAGQPLTIDGLCLRETHYPHRFESEFRCSDPQLAPFVAIALRTLEMCSHESYMDCPFYEQLMYVGDTRLETLVTYATTRDDRLPRKALLMFDHSRSDGGFTAARYPTRVKQVIPTFSLWWIAMVHDYARWRDDPAFVQARLPGVRAVIEAFARCLDADGLVRAPLGWNFIDWVPSWPKGMPPGAEGGVNASVNLQTVLALRLAAELEEHAGEDELAARDRRLADTIAAACLRVFWNPARSLYSEDPAHTCHSEHAQCLALLGGAVPAGQADALLAALLAAPDLARATVYFMHYLFETFSRTGRIDGLFARLGLWKELTGQGLKTVVEMPEPTRSDCHAWGAHPVYHLHASVLGVRPAAFGFRRVVVRPQLGPLSAASGRMVHPAGEIATSFTRDGHGGLHGRICLPPGIPGTLVLPERTVDLAPGSETVF